MFATSQTISRSIRLQSTFTKSPHSEGNFYQVAIAKCNYELERNMLVTENSQKSTLLFAHIQNI